MFGHLLELSMKTQTCGQDSGLMAKGVGREAPNQARQRLSNMILVSRLQLFLAATCVFPCSFDGGKFPPPVLGGSTAPDLLSFVSFAITRNWSLKRSDRAISL